MSETKWTPGPRRILQFDRAQTVVIASNKTVATFTGSNKEANASLDAAAPDLYGAAQLAILMFKRKNVSTADNDWLGDDEHEAWTALEKACAKARGEA